MDYSNQKIYADIIKEHPLGIVLTVKLIPNGSSDSVIGWCSDYFKIKLCSPPIENKANKQLIIFLAKLLKVPKSNISFISGEKSKLKKLLISKVTLQEISKIIFLYDKINS